MMAALSDIWILSPIKKKEKSVVRVAESNPSDKISGSAHVMT